MIFASLPRPQTVVTDDALNNNLMNVYAYLDLDFPPVSWAVTRGMLVSAINSCPEKPEGFISFMQASMIRDQNNCRIFNEAIIEHARSTKYPHKISRLQGLYFFPEPKSARLALEWKGHFKEGNFFQLKLISDAAITICDANWITHAPLEKDGRLNTSDLAWIDHYWSGEREPFSKYPAWEIITSGVALVLDEKIRRHCDAVLKEKYPKSYIALLMARIASEVGTLGGLTAPFLKRISDQRVQLCYLFRDSEFHNQDVIKKISEHPDASYLGKLMKENDTWELPDFREYSQEFSILNRAHSLNNEIPIISIHHSNCLSLFL